MDSNIHRGQDVAHESLLFHIRACIVLLWIMVVPLSDPASSPMNCGSFRKVIKINPTRP